MPLVTNRKKLQQQVDRFKGILEKYECTFGDQRVLTKYHIDYIDRTQVYVGENVHPKWHDKAISDVHDKLSTLSFFKRFQFARLFEMMEKRELKLINAEKLIFFEKNKVYVMVSGSILMQCHQERSDEAMTYGKYKGGDILNFL